MESNFFHKVCQAKKEDYLIILKFLQLFDFPLNNNINNDLEGILDTDNYQNILKSYYFYRVILSSKLAF